MTIRKRPYHTSLRQGVQAGEWTDNRYGLDGSQNAQVVEKTLREPPAMWHGNGSRRGPKIPTEFTSDFNVARLSV